MIRLAVLAMMGSLVAGCSSSDPSGTAVGVVGSDAGSDTGEVAPSTDSGASSLASCDGACAKTALVVTFSGKSAPLTRGQFGVSKSTGLLHVEAHDGGSPACPTANSPQTDRTLVIEDMPVPTDATPIGSKDGVRAAFFDFAGTLLPSTPLAKATAVTLTPTAIVRDGSAPSTIAALALDVDMTFPQGGTLKGHLFAEHCATMDE